MRVFTFDTTLRDGTQGEAISFSADDKIQIVHKLDELGIDYIEGGWPGSNPKDKDFFAKARDLELKHARLVAFGATRFAKNSVEEDPSVNALIAAVSAVNAGVASATAREAFRSADATNPEACGDLCSTGSMAVR